MNSDEELKHLNGLAGLALDLRLISRRYQVKSLGDFGTLAGNEMFAAAKKEAEKLAELVESGGEIRAKIETVADACREYAKDRPEAEQRFKRYVYEDAIAKVKLDGVVRLNVPD